MPSIIPVTVDVARSFPLRASCLPRSAAQADDIKLFKPFRKNPWKNMETYSTPLGISIVAKKYKLKAIRDPNITAIKATGERLP